MEKWLSKAIDVAKTSWNVVRSVGPFLISQSDSASEAFARHKARLAAVDAGQELLLQEIRTLGDVRKKLLERFMAASETERIRTRRDLEEIEGSLRQLKIATQALSYVIPAAREPASLGSGSSTVQSQAEVAPHWMDKFRELARVNNEPWREELLARALAQECSAPGRVSPRVLWLLGTLEERAFSAFATLLDLSTVIDGDYVIPQTREFQTRSIPDCCLGDSVTIGNLVYRLDDVGILAASVGTSITLGKGSRFSARYDNTRVDIECLGAELQITGVIPTAIGTSIAAFYQPKPNPFGKEIFDKWILGLDKASFVIQPS